MKMIRVGLTDAITDFVRDNPGKTASEIDDYIRKQKNFKGLSLTSVSSIVSQGVQRGTFRYVAGPLNTRGKVVRTVHLGLGEKRHTTPPKRQSVTVHRGNQPIVPALSPAPSRAAAAGKPIVDVQVLIAIGKQDTMVGLKEAREIYEKLKEIFESI